MGTDNTTTDTLQFSQENEQIIQDFVIRLTAFSSGVNRNCPHCDQAIEGIHLYEKSEPNTYSLYVEPCDCRLGLWSDVPQWVKDEKLPILIFGFDANGRMATRECGASYEDGNEAVLS